MIWVVVVYRFVVMCSYILGLIEGLSLLKGFDFSFFVEIRVFCVFKYGK